MKKSIFSHILITLSALLIITGANASTTTKGIKGFKNAQEETKLASLGKTPVGDFLKSEKQFSVLSAKDIKTYKKLFKYQRALNRTKVGQLIPQLEDDVLYGHLMAERLLHPKTRVPYSDLKYWLDRFNDHFQAITIYSLANKRKPKKKTFRIANHNQRKKYCEIF